MSAIRRTARFRVGRAFPRVHQRGQGLVEFAMLVPLFLLLLLGILEFGFIFDHTMTITYATREGARSGAAFANGNTTTMVCTNSADVDKYIIAAVQRVLDAPGSQVSSGGVQNIKIFSANAAGTQIGTKVNVYTYSALAGASVDGRNLNFVTTAAATGWNACTRDNTWNGTAAPESIGVSVSYNYQYVTPLGAAVGFFGPPGGSTLLISDRTVMALNPKD